MVNPFIPQSGKLQWLLIRGYYSGQKERALLKIQMGV